MRDFEKKYVFIGVLYNSTVNVENVNCELIVNKLDTNNNKAIVTFMPAANSFVSEIINSREVINVKSLNERRSFQLESRYYKSSMSTETGSSLILDLERCQIEDHYSDNRSRKYHFGFYIPDTFTFPRNNLTTSHYQKGLLSGWTLKNNDDNNNDWEEQLDRINSRVGYLDFIPSFVFTMYQPKTFERKTHIVVEQQIIEHIIEGDDIDERKYLVDLVEEIEINLHLLSFLEGEQIDWSFMRVISSDETGFPVKETVIYKKDRSKKKKRKDIAHYSKYYNSYQLILPILVKKYSDFSNKKKIIFDRILRRFLVASVHDKIDTQLIYWHSCLDLIIKWTKVRGRSFTQKIIKACQQEEIEWTDLYPYLEENEVNKNNGIQLKLNTIRNEMIHDGDYLKDYNVAFTEIRKARALSERFLMILLGCKYNNTGIGLEHKK